MRKDHPLPEEERCGSEHPLTLQRQLRGRLEFGSVGKVTFRPGEGRRQLIVRRTRVGGDKLSTQILLLMKQFPACPTPGLSVEEMGFCTPPYLARAPRHFPITVTWSLPRQVMMLTACSRTSRNTFMRLRCSWGHRVPFRTSKGSTPSSPPNAPPARLHVSV